MSWLGTRIRSFLGRPPSPPDDEGCDPDAGCGGCDACDLADAHEYDAAQRMWIRAIGPLLQIRTEVDAAGSVEKAYDSLRVTACARLKRILRSDLPEVLRVDDGPSEAE